MFAIIAIKHYFCHSTEMKERFPPTFCTIVSLKEANNGKNRHFSQITKTFCNGWQIGEEFKTGWSPPRKDLWIINVEDKEACDSSKQRRRQQWNKLLALCHWLEWGRQLESLAMSHHATAILRQRSFFLLAKLSLTDTASVKSSTKQCKAL